jgi:hypothetical protein
VVVVVTTTEPPDPDVVPESVGVCGRTGDSVSTAVPSWPDDEVGDGVIGVIDDDTDGDTGDDGDASDSTDETPSVTTGVVSRPADPGTAEEQLVTTSAHAAAASAR